MGRAEGGARGARVGEEVVGEGAVRGEVGRGIVVEGLVGCGRGLEGVGG